MRGSTVGSSFSTSVFSSATTQVTGARHCADVFTKSPTAKRSLSEATTSPTTLPPGTYQMRR